MFVCFVTVLLSFGTCRPDRITAQNCISPLETESYVTLLFGGVWGPLVNLFLEQVLRPLLIHQRSIRCLDVSVELLGRETVDQTH